ncbi:MAG TPA: hypothetical protein VKY73_00820 [Polyangiaceae bacterium]|nr:hypothetical protein [Polyangiaceae bacterium]
MSIRWCALVGVLLAGFARAASADEAAEGTDGACRAYLDARLRSCDTLLGQQEKLPEAEKRVADAQQRVAERQRAYDAAAPEAQAAARAELDEALGELASAEAAVLEARKAGTRYDEEDCAAFASVGQVPANVDACDTLASLVGMIRAVRGHRELTTQVPRAEVRERLEAAAIGAQTPETATTVNKSGTPAQIEPVETTRPIALAGGALSFAGTESGGETVATITINPLALGNPNDVRAQRALDLSVTAPVATNGDGRELRFVGIRLRTNGTALYGYDSLRAAAAEYARAAGAFADSVETALRSAPDVGACFDSLVRTGNATRDACGSDFDDLLVQRVRETAYRRLNQARREADKYYWGLDLRLDIGNAGTTNTADKDDVHFLGGLAGGGRIPLGDWDLEYRGRIAGDYFDPRASDVLGRRIRPVISADWGAGFIIAGRPTAAIAKQRLGFGLGLEGRHAVRDDPTDLAATNFVDLRTMVTVPAANGTDLSIGLRLPLQDTRLERGTVITVSGDFGILSPEAEATL